MANVKSAPKSAVGNATDKAVNIDKKLVREDETATDYQNYIRECIKQGKVL